MAARAEPCEQGAFRGNGLKGSGGGDGCEESAKLVVADAAFDAECPLADRPEEFRGSKQRGDSRLQVQTGEAGLGEDEGIVVAAVELFDPRFYVAAHVEHFEVGAEMQELCPAARAAGADPRSLRESAERIGGFRRCDAVPGERWKDERIEGGGASRYGGEHKPGGRFRRKILETVNGDVCAAVEESDLHFAGEESESARRDEWIDAIPVARGGHLHDIHAASGIGGLDQVGHVVGLPECQCARARGDANGGRIHDGFPALLLESRRRALIGCLPSASATEPPRHNDDCHRASSGSHEDLGGFVCGGSGGHDIVDQQERPTSDIGSVRDGECASKIRLSAGSGEARLGRGSASFFQYMAAEFDPQVAGDDAGDGVRGVAAAGQPLGPMMRNGDDAFEGGRPQSLCVPLVQHRRQSRGERGAVRLLAPQTRGP